MIATVMDKRIRSFLEANQSAAMTTLRANGTPHVARIGLGMLDGKIWSSGTQTRLRTKHLRRDSRATLFVFETGYRWLGLETNVTILEGAGVPDQTLRFMQALQEDLEDKPAPGRVMWFGQEKTEEEFLKIMVEEQRLIYEFEVTRAYGMY
ncbi:MAG: pyridoxamine 5'-phosphate oxidase family protein [Chloroflexi bacterium]|nr:pyridoxamine 5'-phosphate oxidase family protein [Chloroflexota bacterium]MCI0856158.1 pyridoxamine 5'-phosphate oxidase family protein [Chloroflexota bacterium]MCI0890801.1 pyridoxamine 5'-phosphate oxidase family protein [Chloroflexota bacterium]